MGIPLMESWVVPLISAIVSCAFTVIGAAIWFGRNAVTKQDLEHAIQTMTTEIHDLTAKINAHGREVGETVFAIRQKIAEVENNATKKITEVELYIRDTFVRRDSWHQAMNQLQVQLAAGDKAAEERSQRIEAKVDALMKHVLERATGVHK